MNQQYNNTINKMINETDKNIIISDFSEFYFNIDPSLIVKNYAPIEPYTILPLSFKTNLDLTTISDILNDVLIPFDIYYLNSESIWYVKHSNNTYFKINIYREKNNLYHIIEFQRGIECDMFSITLIFNKIKTEIEKFENNYKKIDEDIINLLDS
jgi:hypothetical protein